MEQKMFSEIHAYLRQDYSHIIPEDPKDFAKTLFESVSGHERANAMGEGLGFQRNPDQYMHPRGYFSQYLSYLLSYLHVGEKTYDKVMGDAAGNQWTDWMNKMPGFSYHDEPNSNTSKYYNELFAERFEKP